MRAICPSVSAVPDDAITFSIPDCHVPITSMPLHEKALVLAHYFVFGLMDAVELAVFLVYVGFG